ncbi:MAG: orotidine-5'-phosphate decarboxylase [Deltaproteobacteria bacterium]|jgi:orotidine-5'-phosphate decarboxylase|nr:orotidine-5'-phosphate decarboxylase [Deltaproteobacteria bacterium]
MNPELIKSSTRAIDHLAFALDVNDPQIALCLVESLSGRVGYFKIGLELFASLGPQFVTAVREKAPESGLFLDLKLHDIPVTVGRAVKALAYLKPDLLTIHAQGGQAMMKAAVEEAGESVILAVTVLTSLTSADFPLLSSPDSSPRAYALSLADKAVVAGCQGLVCSPLEASDLRAKLGPEPLLVVPGVRPSWMKISNDDQKRAASVESALAAGADLLVVGRPIRQAPDPAQAAERICQEIALALKL